MKKSKSVSLGLLAVVAITAVGCDDPPAQQEVKHCVDPDGIVVDESLCQGLNSDPNDGGVVQTTDDAGQVIYVPRSGFRGNSFIFYRWYYGGYSRPVTRGTRIITNGYGYGSFRPSTDHVYSSPSTFSKGGFGATGRGFSVGGGGGGGE